MTSSDAPHFETKVQTHRGSSPWTRGERIKWVVWCWVYWFLFRPTPKTWKRWRLFLLRRFGARISGSPFVSNTAIIRFPWKLEMEDRACLAPRSEVYNLGPVKLGAGCVISQEAYLCCGTHDLEDPKLPLVTAPIEIGAEAFIGARAFIMPGVNVGTGGVVGAGSVLTKDCPPWTICAGNPAKPLKERAYRGPRPGLDDR